MCWPYPRASMRTEARCRVARGASRRFTRCRNADGAGRGLRARLDAPHPQPRTLIGELKSKCALFSPAVRYLRGRGTDVIDVNRIAERLAGVRRKSVNRTRCRAISGSYRARSGGARPLPSGGVVTGRPKSRTYLEEDRSAASRTPSARTEGGPVDRPGRDPAVIAVEPRRQREVGVQSTTASATSTDS
jgi:hypothetical protein